MGRERSIGGSGQDGRREGASVPAAGCDAGIADAVRAAIAVSGCGDHDFRGMMDIVREVVGRRATRAECARVMADAVGFGELRGQARAMARHGILVELVDGWRWNAGSKDDIMESLAILNATPLHMVMAAACRPFVSDPAAMAAQIGERLGLPCEVTVGADGIRGNATGRRLAIKGKEGQGWSAPDALDLSDGTWCPFALTLDWLPVDRIVGLWAGSSILIHRCDPGRLGTLDRASRVAEDIHPGVDPSGAVRGTADLTLNSNGFASVRGLHCDSVNLLDERELGARSADDLGLAKSVTSLRVTGLTNLSEVDGHGLGDGFSLDYSAVPKGARVSVRNLRGDSGVTLDMDYNVTAELEDCSLRSLRVTVPSGPVGGGDSRSLRMRGVMALQAEVTRTPGSLHRVSGERPLAGAPLRAWDFGGGILAESCAFGRLKFAGLLLDARGGVRLHGSSVVAVEMDGLAAKVNPDLLDGVRFGPPDPLAGPPPGMPVDWTGPAMSTLPSDVLARLVGMAGGGR